MAIRFIDDQDTGAMQKIQYNPDDLSEQDKANLELAEDEGALMTVKEIMGNSKGTVPKETVTSDKIEIDAGSALADQFMNLTEDKQAQVLENIGLSKVEPTSDKDLYKDLSKEEQEQFRSKTNTKKTGLIKSAGKALS